MVSSSRQAIAWILLILSTAISAQSQTAVDKNQNSSVSGKVTVKGKGVSGVVVGLEQKDSRRSNVRSLRAVTDDDGGYRIANVPPGNYQVIVSALVYVAATARKSIIIGKAEVVENLDFALVRGGVITGKITDDEGRPIVEEEVRITLSTGEGLYPARTDDRGVYRAFGIAPGRYIVSVGKEESASFGDMWERGNHKVTFYRDADDASKATLIEVTEGSEATDIDITLAEARSLTKYTAYGRVVDGETGRPVPNVRYGVQMFVTAQRTSGRSTGAVSNSRGEFRLDNLSPGKYAVFVEPPLDGDWGAEPLRFEVVDQDVENLIIKTTKGGSVSGQIVLEGIDDKTIQANVGKARIFAYVAGQSPGRRSNPSATINADSSFQVRGLVAGSVTFWLSSVDQLQIVRVERDGVAYTKGLTIKEQENISGLRVIVNQANGTIRGVVKLETGSQPPGSQIYITLRRMVDDVSTYYDSRDVDSRGQFVAVGLLPGTYEIGVVLKIPNERNTGMPRATQQVVVTNGAVTNVVLTLQPQQAAPNRP